MFGGSGGSGGSGSSGGLYRDSGASAVRFKIFVEPQPHKEEPSSTDSPSNVVVSLESTGTGGEQTTTQSPRERQNSTKKDTEDYFLKVIESIATDRVPDSRVPEMKGTVPCAIHISMYK